MLVLTKYGPVEVNVGDTLTCGNYNWTVVSISDPGKDFVDGMYQDRAPVVLVHDPQQPDLSAHEFHKLTLRPGLVCHLLDEMNVRSFVCGQNGAYNGEYIAARLYEQRNNIPFDHIPDYVVAGEIALDKTIDHDLSLEGMAREIGHGIQMARKKAKLKQEDYIVLFWESDDPFIKETFDILGRYIYNQSQSTFGDPGEGAVITTLKLDHNGVKHELPIKFKVCDGP